MLNSNGGRWLSGFICGLVLLVLLWLASAPLKLPWQPSVVKLRPFEMPPGIQRNPERTPRVPRRAPHPLPPAPIV